MKSTNRLVLLCHAMWQLEGPGVRVVGVVLQYDVAKGGDHLPRVRGVGDCVVPRAGEDQGVALLIFLD